jgi:putative tryptophan/tyrosine transport system substrate-binding protein
MRRRDLITGFTVLLVAPRAAEAQAPKAHRIGYLAQGYSFDRHSTNQLDGFRRGLRELGYEEGHNFGIESRWAELNLDRLPALAAELVELKVELIAAVATRASLAAKQATSTIPIVMTLSLHAVESGLVDSLSRPGGNVTGMSGLSDATIVKRLELLKEVLPRLERVAVLWNPDFYRRTPEPQWRALEAAAPRVGMSLHPLEARVAGDLEGAFEAAAQDAAQAILVLPDPLTIRYGIRLAQLALRHRLPTIFQDRESVEVGGLMSYGFDFYESSRRAAAYVDKILKGAKPADLPIEQPTQFQLVINVKTAKTLGITIPPSLLARADEVIE